jgi:hypothetical protein
MRVMSRVIGVIAALVCWWPSSSSAQAVWDAPSFVHPGAPWGLTLALTDQSPGSGLGVMALWRRSAAPVGIGFRAGISEAPSDDVFALFGVDVSGSLTRALGTRGPAAIWWSGAGMSVGDDVIASLPLGVAFSWAWQGDGLSVAPWIGGHLAMDVHMGDRSDLDLDAAVDLGMDMIFPGWVIRLGAALGGRDALAIGVRIPG